MDFVQNEQHLIENIKYLEAIRLGPENADKIAFRKLMKRGICFLPYKVATAINFAPSRFLGYIDNKITKHGSNESKHGTKTNTALTAILGIPPRPDGPLNELYDVFCRSLGFEPKPTGSVGMSRKYWVTDDIRLALDDRAERAIDADPLVSETERAQLAKARIGQGKFRRALIDRWGECCLSGCKMEPILRASHIKPWYASTNQERLDDFNGLLLSPNLDALFDKGFISFEVDGTLVLSPQLSKETATALGVLSGRTLNLDQRHKPYIEYHRTNIFRDKPHLHVRAAH